MTTEERMQEAMHAIWLVIDSQQGEATAHTIHELARVPGGRGGYRPIDFSELMFLLGTMTGLGEIVLANDDQPWTGQWADVKWRAAPRTEWRAVPRQEWK